jgi:sensor histidine kinase YesM
MTIAHALLYGIAASFAFSLLLIMNFLLVVYPVRKLLIPRFANRKKKYNIYCYIVCSIALIYLVSNLAEQTAYWLYRMFDLTIKESPEMMKFKYYLVSIFAFVVCNMSFLGVKMMEERRQKEILANEKKVMEMRALKSQINSHFLFNALNNIYSMIYFGNKDAAKYVTKLSQMLRYVLDDCEAEQVPMANEISYIENYIDFQKARFDTDKNILFKSIKTTTKAIYVPPMIFQPLIENCFKYCSLDEENSYVHIELAVDDNQLKFNSENTQQAIKQSANRNSKGIGIETLKRRLYLTYKDNYELNIMDKQDIFRVELSIKI